MCFLFYYKLVLDQTMSRKPLKHIKGLILPLKYEKKMLCFYCYFTSSESTATPPPSPFLP